MNGRNGDNHVSCHTHNIVTRTETQRISVTTRRYMECWQNSVCFQKKGIKKNTLCFFFLALLYIYFSQNILQPKIFITFYSLIKSTALESLQRFFESHDKNG